MKPMRISTGVLLCLTVFSAGSLADEKGLIVSYNLAQASETIARDQSGNQHHGQIHGAVRMKSGQGHVLRFDGIDDYIEVPTSAELRFQKFTLELWVKLAQGRVPLISKPFNEIRSSFLLQVSGSPVRIYGAVLDPDGSTEHYFETRKLSLVDAWTHIALTCDGRWLRLYLNGEQETFAPVGRLPFNEGRRIPYTPKPLQIGRSFYAPQWSYFRGDIADVRIYDRTLSSAEVLAHRRNGGAFLRESRPKLRKDPPASQESKTARSPSRPDPTDKMLALVRDGQPVATIVVPHKATYWTQEAARWFQQYVQRATGAKLPIVDEKTGPTTGVVISIGHTQLARQDNITVTDVRWDGCKLVVQGDRLYLIGRDVKAAFQNPKSGISDGNCRAVVTFLEDHCGVRWFLPGPKGELVPKRPDLRVPLSLSKSFDPAFAFSSGRFPFGSEGVWLDNITPAAIANNFRRGIAATSGGHTYYSMVPAGKHFQEDPTMFALIDGKRTAEGNHLCSTHPEVRRLLLRGMQEQFDKGYDVVTLGQEDGYARCQCPNCEKLDDYRFSASQMSWQDFQRIALRKTPCERLFSLHKSVIDEVRQSHPDGIVLLFAYAPTAWPSKKIGNWGNNVWVELTNQDPEIVQSWRGKTRGVTGYVYWFDIQLPMGMDVHATPAEAARRIRYLHENGFLGLYHFPETNFGFQGPVIYTLGKLMGDPYLDPDALVEEFCQGVYGKAAGSMLQFFGLLYEVHEQRMPFHLRQGGRWPKWLTTSDLYLMLYTPDVLKSLESSLSKAEAEADTERTRCWVRHTREYFDFTTLLTEAVTAHRVYQRDETKQNWLNLKLRVSQFNRYRLKVLGYDKSYTDKWFPGHGHFCNWLTGDAQHESKVYYTPWTTRKPEVLRRCVEGMAIGYGGGPGYSFVKEPFTLDLSK